jgi:uncharacterized protein
MPLRIGVISDTHGLLRPEALTALAGVDAVLHAGDVGSPEILERLAGIAPLTAIRGNIDRSGPCARLPAEEYVTLGEINLYLVHDRATLSLDPAAAGIHMVIFGHSHKPLLERSRDVFFFNPGAAGPRRFSLPITLGLLHIDGRELHSEHVALL